MKGYHKIKEGIAITYDDVYLINGARTPFGRFCGTLGRISPIDLGIFASKAAIERSGLAADEIDQAIIANIGQSCKDAYFLPRHIALYAGLDEAVPALMVQRICASGLETIITGAEQIVLGKADSVLACGTENMSLAPTVSFGNRMGYNLGRIEFQDMLWEALDDTAAGYPMGETAENLAVKYNISRDEVDNFAIGSQNKAIRAAKSGLMAREIIQINSTVFEREGLTPRKVRLSGKVENFVTDENVRETSMEILGRLNPSFKKDGVQTAGNSSGIVDGSAAVIVGSGNLVKTKNLKPLARVVASASTGVDPKYMGIGPVPSIKLALKVANLRLEDIGLFEINEAFGAQLLACVKELNLDPEKVNVNGGAIAYGHPLAATGTRLSLTMAHEMKKRNVRYGIASACIGGGQGTALILENTDAI